MKGVGRKGMTQCPSPSWWLCHPWVWSSRCSLLQMCRLSQLKADPPVRPWYILRSSSLPSSHRVKPKAIFLSCWVFWMWLCRVCRSSRLWTPGGKVVHLSKEMSVMHVKWPVRAPSHLLAETWNGKHVQWAQSPTGSASSQEVEWCGMKQTRDCRQPTCLGVSQCEKHLLGGVLGMRIGIYRDRLTSSLLPGSHFCCYGNGLFH